MGCLLVLIAMAVPRVVIFFIWLLTDWFRQAYDSVFWPVLGFLFLPYTTLAYMAAMLNNHHALTGWWVVLLIMAIMADLGHVGGSGRKSIRVRHRWRERQAL